MNLYNAYMKGEEYSVPVLAHTAQEAKGLGFKLMNEEYGYNMDYSYLDVRASLVLKNVDAPYTEPKAFESCMEVMPWGAGISRCIDWDEPATDCEHFRECHPTPGDGGIKCSECDHDCKWRGGIGQEYCVLTWDAYDRGTSGIDDRKMPLAEAVEKLLRYLNVLDWCYNRESRMRAVKSAMEYLDELNIDWQAEVDKRKAKEL